MENQKTGTRPEKEKTSLKAEIISWIQVIVCAALIAFFMNGFIIANSRVPSASMENTIMTNMTGDDFLSAVLLALDMKGTEVEGIRMPVDDSYYLDSEAGMSTQWIDTEVNREALHTFLYGTSFAVID